MGSLNRDTGLVRVMGPVSLAASMVSIVVGSGIFLVPAELSRSMGSFAPLAMLACALVVGAVGVCMAECGSRVPSSGGVYAFVDAAFGPCASYVAGTLFWIANVLACGAVASALGAAVAAVLPLGFRAAAHASVAVGTVAVVCAINIVSVDRGIRLVNLSTLVKLIPLTVFVGVGFFAIHGENFTGPTSMSAGDIGRTLFLTMFALQGFEVSLCAGGEIRDPNRTIPRAILLALSGVTLLYIAVQVIAQGILGPSLAGSAVPLADAMGRISPALRLLMLIGAAISMFGWLTTDLLGSPRILFAFARDGLLPRVLGRLNANGHAPYVAIICYGAIAAALALSGSFAQLAVPASLLLTALYFAACASAWQLARRGIARAGEPLGFRWLTAAVVIGAGSMLTMIALASRTEILGLLILTALSLLVYLIQTRVLYRQQPAV